MKMSITRALAEIKTLDSRISKKIDESNFVSYSIGKKPVIGYKTNEEFNNQAKSSLSSIKDLIDLRSKIKAAIVAKNAEVLVTIADKEMTVADAIEKKNSITYEKELLSAMKQQFLVATSKVEEINRNMEVTSDQIANSLAGKDTKVNPESLEYIKKFMQDVKEPQLVDGVNVKKQIEDLDNFITDFEKEVDFTLSESNTRTEIEI